MTITLGKVPGVGIFGKTTESITNNLYISILKPRVESNGHLTLIARKSKHPWEVTYPPRTVSEMELDGIFHGGAHS